MDIRITNQAVKDVPCDALVVGAAYKQVGQQTGALVLAGAARDVDNLLGGLIHSIYAGGEFKGERGELLTLHPMDKLAAKRIAIVGLGAQEHTASQVIRPPTATPPPHFQQPA